MTARAGAGVPLTTSTPAGHGPVASAGTANEAARADHVHPSASGVLLPSGYWVQGTTSNNSSGSLTLNREYCVGLDLQPQTIAGFAILVTNTPDSGSKIRLGLRADNGSMQPGLPVWQEQLAADGGAGQKYTTTVAYDHPGGLLWFSWTGQSWVTTAPSIRSSSLIQPFVRPWATAAWRTSSGNPTNIPAGTASLVAYQDSVTGSLPNTFVTAAASNECIEFFIKRA